MNKEDIYVHCHASIQKYFESPGLGLPLIWLQHGTINDTPVSKKGSIEFLITGPDFDKKGSRIETYADLKISIFVKTKIVEDDIFYHQRIMGRVIQKTNQSIPIFSMGVPGIDPVHIGQLRYLPMDTISVSAKEPLGSVVEQIYELEIC